MRVRYYRLRVNSGKLRVSKDGESGSEDRGYNNSMVVDSDDNFKSGSESNSDEPELTLSFDIDTPSSSNIKPNGAKQ